MTHYINCILEDLGNNSASGNPTYTHGLISKDLRRILKIIYLHLELCFYMNL